MARYERPKMPWALGGGDVRNAQKKTFQLTEPLMFWGVQGRGLDPWSGGGDPCSAPDRGSNNERRDKKTCVSAAALSVVPSLSPSGGSPPSIQRIAWERQDRKHVGSSGASVARCLCQKGESSLAVCASTSALTILSGFRLKPRGGGAPPVREGPHPFECKFAKHIAALD